MPYSTQLARWGYKKEATRLTAESAPDTWQDFDPGSGFKYEAKTIEDVGLRGIKANYPPEATIKELSGELSGPVRAQNIGQILQMLLGTPSSAQQGATAAYKHTYNEPSSIQIPTYTFFEDRSLDVFKYSGVGCSKLEIELPNDGVLKYKATMLGITEAAGASIGTPSYSESAMLSASKCTFKIAGSANQNVKSWNVSLDNGMVAKRVLAQSQDADDILAVGRMAVDGGFVIIFENQTERDKFLANTKTSIQATLVGDVADTGFNYTFDMNLYDVRYNAFPFGDEDGILAAQVGFTSHYSTADSKQLQIDLTNLKTGY